MPSGGPDVGQIIAIVSIGVCAIALVTLLMIVETKRGTLRKRSRPHWLDDWPT